MSIRIYGKFCVDEQTELIQRAKKHDLDWWKEKIMDCNGKLFQNLSDTESGWQLLTGYDILRVGSLDITTRQYPYFESFLNCFVLEEIKEDADEDFKVWYIFQHLFCFCPFQNSLHSDHVLWIVVFHRYRYALKESDTLWYSAFKQSWVNTPDWWDKDHDIVLLQLALKHADKWSEYTKELTGDKASDFMMRLRDTDPELQKHLDLSDDETSSDHLKTNSSLFVPGHNLRKSSDYSNFNMDSITGTNPNDVHPNTKAQQSEEEVKDVLRPYLEFQHWMSHEANILHRLKYVTTKLMQNLIEVKKSLVDIRIPKAEDQPQFESDSLVFSEYEKNKHLEHVKRNQRLREVDDYKTEDTYAAMRLGTERMQRISLDSKTLEFEQSPKAKGQKGHLREISDRLSLFGKDVVTSLANEVNQAKRNNPNTVELTLKNAVPSATFDPASKTPETPEDTNTDFGAGIVQIVAKDDNTLYKFPNVKHKSVLRVINDQEEDSESGFSDDIPLDNSGGAERDDVSDVDEMEIRIHGMFLYLYWDILDVMLGNTYIYDAM